MRRGSLVNGDPTDLRLNARQRLLDKLARGRSGPDTGRMCRTTSSAT